MKIATSSPLARASSCPRSLEAWLFAIAPSKSCALAVCAAVLSMQTALPAAAACTGDCDGDGRVLVNELVSAVAVALGEQLLAACPASDADADGAVGVAELVAAVGIALGGCRTNPTPAASATAEPPTAAPTRAPSPPSPTALPATPTRTFTSTLGTTPESTSTPGRDQDPPTRGEPLRDWLEAGSYLGWAAESAPHASSGPHFGTVRVFVNDRLLDSLARGLASHAAGAATVGCRGANTTSTAGRTTRPRYARRGRGGVRENDPFGPLRGLMLPHRTALDTASTVKGHERS